MPKKLLAAQHTHSLIQERLTTWGRAIRHTRHTMRMKAADLGERVGVSPATLARMENGDPGVAIGSYLTAFLVLGLLDQAAPVLPRSIWEASSGERVRLSKAELGADDDGYF